MINSLSKDSHISRTVGQHKLLSPQGFVQSSLRQNTTADKCEITNKKPTEITFGGLPSPSAKKPGSMLKWIYESKAVKKILEFADDQQLVFGAAFALFLTCVLRPGSIMLLPSKKNQDDQKYASGHSIASGIIGFAISTVAFTPISSGIKKFSKIGEDNEMAKKYLKNRSGYWLEETNKAGEKPVKGNLKLATKYLDRLPDIVGSIPKGILTIMLIPPILKYVFGLEKKKKASNSDNKINYTAVDYSLLNYQKGNLDDKFKATNPKGGLK